MDRRLARRGKREGKGRKRSKQDATNTGAPMNPVAPGSVPRPEETIEDQLGFTRVENGRKTVPLEPVPTYESGRNDQHDGSVLDLALLLPSPTKRRLVHSQSRSFPNPGRRRRKKKGSATADTRPKKARTTTEKLTSIISTEKQTFRVSNTAGEMGADPVEPNRSVPRSIKGTNEKRKRVDSPDER